MSDIWESLRRNFDQLVCGHGLQMPRRNLSLNADVRITMRTPCAALETRLLKFLRSAKNASSVRKLARDGMAIDASVKALLKTFPSNLFWSAFRNLESVDTYPPDKNGVLYPGFRKGGHTRSKFLCFHRDLAR
jgi:hypothetical protein